MAKWIEYTGSDEQIKEMLFAANKHGVMIIHHNGELCPGIFTDANELSQHLDKRTKYPIRMFLLCQPHQYADIIKIWAETGCEVYVQYTKPTRDGFNMEWFSDCTAAPNWSILGAEYRLTPF